MDDQREQQPEGWQAHDLRSGVVKVFQEAKERNTLGLRIAAGWGALMLVFGLANIGGAATTAPMAWDFGVSVVVMLLAAVASSRAPGPLLAAAVFVIIDLGVVGFHFPDLLEEGTVTDQVATGLRIAAAPVALTFVLMGYFAGLSIQAFKRGFSPGADWRTRMSPRTMQLLVIGACALALLLGAGTWVTAVMNGFAETKVTWLTKSLLYKPIKVKVTKKNIGEAERDGKKEDVFAEFDFTNEKKKEEKDKVVPYPEAAKPVTSLEGLDEFSTREVEDAFEFGAETNEAGCLLEGQRRHDRCREDLCRFWARVFLRACLTKSRKTKHFCDGVPEPMAVSPGLAWAERICAGRLLESCRELVYGVQGHCHPPKPEDATTELTSRGRPKSEVPKSPNSK